MGDPIQQQTLTPPNCSTSICLYLPLVMSSAPEIPDGHAWTSYYYAGGSRVAMRVQSNQEGQEEGLYYFLSDHLGSTAVTLDAGANRVAELRYSAWGETRYTSGTTPTQRRYTGQMQAEAGLYFYQARWFDPSLGRFAQADSIIPEPGNAQDWDRYAGMANNPVLYSDPTGHAIYDRQKYLFDGMGTNEWDTNSLWETLGHFPQHWNELDASQQAALTSVGWNESYFESELFTGSVSNIAGTIYDPAVWISAIAGIASVASIKWVSTVVTTACMDGDCGNEARAAQQAGQSIWKLNPFDRGIAVENVLGRTPGLVQNFPMIDRWYNGVASSIKSLDLTAPSYQNIVVLTSKVQGYVNSLANWRGTTWGGVIVNKADIIGRELILAIPPGGSPNQLLALQQLQQSALVQGVSLILVTIK